MKKDNNIGKIQVIGNSEEPSQCMCKREKEKRRERGRKE